MYVDYYEIRYILYYYYYLLFILWYRIIRTLTRSTTIDKDYRYRCRSRPTYCAQHYANRRR